MKENSQPTNILRLNRNLNERQKTPFGYTLAGMTGVCIAVYAALFVIPEYVGALVLVIGLGCGVTWIVGKVRRAFTYASHDLADFVRGKDKKESLQVERLKAVRAAIAEAKARKEAASKGLKQPNQSSTVRYLNERLSALICEQLQLEGALGKKVV